ncbi:hypothetical protein MJD09_22115, partial [bacterium]|nr:hypothetical protein [bacterium]
MPTFVTAKALKHSLGRLSWLSMLALAVLLAVSTMASPVGAQAKWSASGSGLTDANLNKELQMAELGRRFLDNVKAEVARVQDHELFLSRIKGYSAEEIRRQFQLIDRMMALPKPI